MLFSTLVGRGSVLKTLPVHRSIPLEMENMLHTNNKDEHKTMIRINASLVQRTLFSKL